MKKNILMAIGLLSVVLIFFVNAKKSAEGSSEIKFEVGEYATDFNLKDVNGNMVSMSGMRDAKGFILIFTCNTCPFSKMYEERIVELTTKYTPKGFPVIAINPNDGNRSPGDSYNEMKVRAKEQGLNFPYLYDETQETTKAFGASRTPHVFVLNKEGDKLKVEYVGAIDNNYRDASLASKKYVEQAVDNLLKGKQVETKFTKTIGCGIKWKES